MQPEPRQRQPRQAELFEAPSDRPSWMELPLQVRSAVIQELARLLGSLRHLHPEEGREVEDE